MARVPGSSERTTDGSQALNGAREAWSHVRARPLFAAGDATKVIKRLPLALRLAGAALRDPHAFRTTALAIRRHRALQKPLELFAYLRFLRSHRIERCLEIGTWWGGMFFAHAASTSSTGHVIAVDAFPPESPDNMTARFRALARATQRVTCIWRDSHTEATARDVMSALEGAPIDLLFLDGDHSPEGIADDYERYAPLVRTGGLIAFHDIDASGDSGVPAIWQSLRARHEHVELIDRRHAPHGLGIGVIVKG